MNADSPAPLIPAATVVVGRDAPSGSGVEVLLLQRSSNVAFGDVWTFPGGKLEESDFVGSYRGGDSTPIEDASFLASCRAAAVREAHEECGVRLDPSDLVALSHWIPPTHIPRRFATWFFWTSVPAAVTVTVDGSEMVDSCWVSPADAIAPASRFGLTPPTWVTLHLLRGADSLASVYELLEGRQPRHYETKMVREPDQLIALWNGDSGYASGNIENPGPRHRLVMPDSGPWSFVHSV